MVEMLWGMFNNNPCSHGYCGSVGVAVRSSFWPGVRPDELMVGLGSSLVVGVEVEVVVDDEVGVVVGVVVVVVVVVPPTLNFCCASCKSRRCL